MQSQQILKMSSSSLNAGVCATGRWHRQSRSVAVRPRPQPVTLSTRSRPSLFGRPYYRSSLWYSVSSVVCLSVVCLYVCDVLYCGKTVRPSQKVSEGVNRKPGSKSSFFWSPPYFYFRFRRYGHHDGRFCLIFARTAQQSILDGTN